MTQVEPDGTTLVSRATQAFTRFQDGDRAAFDELVTLATPLLWRTVRGAGLDATASEDVIQTVWMSLLHSAERIRDPQTVVKWLLTTARREAWRVSSRTRTEVGRAGAVFGVDDEETMALPEPEEDQPEEVVVRSTRQQRLWNHVKALPPRCRQLLGVIAFADKPDYALIAESLGMPVGSIGPTRGRCLAKLRDALSQDPQWEGLAT